MTQLPHRKHRMGAPGASVALSRLAARQFGVVRDDQLLELGFSRRQISRAIAAGRLHRLLPGVYAVGHRAIPWEGHLVAALFWVGGDAALSHRTAAAWWGLTEARGDIIHVSCTKRRNSRPGIRVHQPRELDALRHNRLPVTTVPRTLLDCAATVPFTELRYILATADFCRCLSVPAVEAQLRRGRRGSAALSRALAIHRPELARTRSVLERHFIPLLEREGIPIPELNVRVCGHLVDCHWPDRLVVAELDGGQAHGTIAAVRRDRQRDLDLRAAGYTVLRYSSDQVRGRPSEVAADLRRALAMI